MRSSRIGIAVGPFTWFGKGSYDNFTRSGVITGNYLGGAFSYGIAVSSARNFTIQNNILIGNTSFIDVVGPNCSKTNPPPNPAPFIVDPSMAQGLTLQSNFETATFPGSLICVQPPNGGDYWPFANSTASPSSTKLTAGKKAEIGRAHV